MSEHKQQFMGEAGVPDAPQPSQNVIAKDRLPHAISDRCPACGRETLFLGDGGWITCSYLPCKFPGVTAWVEMIKDLRDALMYEVKASRAAFAGVTFCKEGFSDTKLTWEQVDELTALVGEQRERLRTARISVNDAMKRDPGIA